MRGSSRVWYSGSTREDPTLQMALTSGHRVCVCVQEAGQVDPDPYPAVRRPLHRLPRRARSDQRHGRPRQTLLRNVLQLFPGATTRRLVTVNWRVWSQNALCPFGAFWEMTCFMYNAHCILPQSATSAPHSMANNAFCAKLLLVQN